MSNIIPMDYEGQLVRFNSGGWIDATSAAKRFGREAREWLRSVDTLELLLALADDLFGKSVSQTDLEKLRSMKSESSEAKTLALALAKSTGLVKTERGRHGGTWLHPELGVHFAYWLDKKFAIWAGRRIVELLNGQTVTPVALDAENVKGMFIVLETMLGNAEPGSMSLLNQATTALTSNKQLASLCGTGLNAHKNVRRLNITTMKRLYLEAQFILRFD